MTVSEFTLAHHISPLSSSRKVNHFTAAGKLSPDIKPHAKPILLGGGMPSPSTFLIDEIRLKLSGTPASRKDTAAAPRGLNLVADSLDRTVIIPKYDTTAAIQTAGAQKKDPLAYALPLDSKSSKNFTLDHALQYGPMKGQAQLLKFTRDLIKRVHPPRLPEDQWDTIITNGGGDGISKVVDLLVSPGDNVLVEEYAFSPTYDTIRAYGGKIVAVKLNDTEGLDLDDLERILTTWDKDPDLGPSRGKKPHVLYSIPSGQNPTGISQSLSYRRKIYELAQQHDLIIFEDDPYGYLVFPDYFEGNPKTVESPDTVDEFLKQIAPSYLTIDVDGRVIRVDTFSKVFGPGLRLGFIVAHKAFIERITAHTSVSTRAASGISQAIFLNTVGEWGLEGWLQWVSVLRDRYIIRRDTLLNAIDQLHSKHISYRAPNAGMFVIPRIDFKNHPNYKPAFDGEDDFTVLQHRLYELALQQGVVLVTGGNMAAEPQGKRKADFVRLTFAYEDLDDIVEGINRFGSAVDLLFNE